MNENRIEAANIRWLENGIPFAEKFADIYFSAAGGPDESCHVFLAANDLATRFGDAAGNFVIGELGFGSGLNFLLCWQLWRRQRQPGRRLHYIGFEKHPLRHADLQRITSGWPALADVAGELLAVYPDHTPGLHRLLLADDLTLDLYYGDALSRLQASADNWLQAADCWFLDGFSPSRNPDLWSPELLALLARLSHAQTTLSSYSVAGEVRRRLSSAGFAVRKQPGFGSKREMLYATRQSPHQPAGQQVLAGDPQPWFRLASLRLPGRRVAVIGAGLAGCATANRLAARGWEVDVVESGPAPANAASGNPQAALLCRLAANSGPISRFYLAAFLHARRQFDLLARQGLLDWHGDGLLLQSPNRRQAGFYEPAVLQAVAATTASELAGSSISDPCWWLPQGGWLDPRQLCAAWLGHDRIRLLTDTPVDCLRRESDQWLLMSRDQIVTRVDAVVLANGHHVVEMEQCRDLPLLPVRGQVVRLRETAASSRLRVVLSGTGYLCPAGQGVHTAGASYLPGATDTSVSTAETAAILGNLQQLLPRLQLGEAALAGARASIRCATPDQVPVVGPVPDREAMLAVFHQLGRNARLRPQSSPVCHAGLYVNSGHGSHGLTSCPLAAEYLAALMSGEILPLPRAQTDALHPARFLIRRLKRQQTDSNC